MADQVPHELIIVKRHEEEEHEHHSSAWKVAHADFMTAMMAFFLIMWLINVTDSQTKKAISEYFNPIRLSEGKTEVKGLSEIQTELAEEARKTGFGDAPDPNLKEAEGRRGSKVSAEPIPERKYERSGLAEETLETTVPGQMSGGSGDENERAGSSPLTTDGAAAAAEQRVAEVAAEQGAEEAAAVRKVAEIAADEGVGGEHSGAAASAMKGALPGSSGVMSQGEDREREHAAFQDPYALLAELAEQYSAAHALTVDVIEGDDRPPGVAGGEVDRDPFDPVYWQMAPMRPALADAPNDLGSAEAARMEDMPDAAAPTMETPADATVEPTTGPAPAAPVEWPADAGAEQPATGPVPESPVDWPTELAAAPADDGEGGVDPETAAEAEAIAAEIAEAVEALMGGEESPKLSVKATEEGILIDLTDDDDFGMFEIGSAIPDAKVVVLMEKVAPILSRRPGPVVVRGFTDGRPFRSDTYDNWRLSAARAHMAYYMLVHGGLADTRVVAIEGYADRSLFNAADPLAAENRRIEILLKRAE